MTTSKPFAQANIQAHLQILSVGAAEASPTCLVITDRDRFMLNVGEGTQRLAMEHKVRLTRFDHIFLTALTPEALGGLPGMLLTMADCGKTVISIHGPVGLRALLRATSHFMRREDLKIIIREYGTTGLAMQGPTLAMHALPLFPNSSACAPAPEQEPPQPPPEQEQEKGQQQNGNEPTTKRPRIATAIPISSASSPPNVAWVGQTASVLGKFDVVRARELGIPTGPLYGKLKAGHAVTLPDGRTIQAEEVVAPPTPGAIFGVIHLPDGEREGKEERNGDSNTFSSLLALPPSKSWIEAALGTAAAATAPADTPHLTCMLHYTSAALVHTPLYQEWMKSFGPSTTHILTALPSGTHQSPYRAARLNNLRLHLLDPVVFPRAAAPTNPSSILLPGKEEGEGEEGEEEKVNVVWGGNLMKYQLLPENKKGLDESGVLGDVGEVEEEELRADAEFRQVMLPPPLTVEEEEREEEEEKEGGKEGVEEVEIVFLGTGSAIPSKYRNVSGIYVRVGGSGERRRRRRRKEGEGGDGGEAQEEGDTAKGMLLDVGEGSLGQLAALYEGEALSRVLVNLKAIWISHPHADHHLGLMKVLVARRQAAASLSLPGRVPFPLLVLAPRPLLAWLREYRQWDPTVQWYCNDEGGKEDGKEEEYLVDVERMSPFAYIFLKRELGLLNLTNVVVHHCPFAFGVVLDGVAGWRLVYSGDTRPCQRLVHAGKGATILIHEATFESSKAADAVERKHSTVDEALDIARRMEAKTVILTHFSQRYPKFPVLPSGSELRVCVAFDLMKLHFRDVSRAAALLPMLQKLFPAEEEEEVGEEVLGVVDLGGGPK
eukprot:evm.model.NODE_23078_length_13312_cov_30.534330.2